jgi:hypothetical protein
VFFVLLPFGGDKRGPSLHVACVIVDLCHVKLSYYSSSKSVISDKENSDIPGEERVYF